VPARGLTRVTVLVITLLATPIAVSAAVVYRIETEPPMPRVGETTTIIVSTLFPATPPATATEPQHLDAFPWKFVAESPRRSRHVLILTRSDKLAHQWTAKFIFDQPGPWEVGLDRSHLGIPVDPTLGARTTVNVRGPDDPRLALFAFVAASLVLVGLAVMSIRRRDRR